MAKSSQYTPRTDIAGAHQQNLHVKQGAKLSSKRSLLAYKRIYLGAVVAFLAVDWIPDSSTLGTIKQSVFKSYTALRYLPTGFQIVALGTLIIFFALLASVGRPYWKFAYNCFIKPFFVRKPSGVDSEEHQVRLEMFYKDQADIYDVTRRKYSKFN